MSSTTRTSNGTRRFSPPWTLRVCIEATTAFGLSGVVGYRPWKDLEFEIEDVLDAGENVVALIRNQRQFGRHTGIVTEVPPYALVFTLHYGKVVRWRFFPDRDAALKTVGLRE